MSSTIQISVLLPVYNEARWLAALIERLDQVNWPVPVEFIWVNDGSTDGSWKILNRYAGRPNFCLLYHAGNQGKAAAIRTALRHVRGKYVITHDTDLEYDPAELPALLQPLLRNEVDVVYGSRFMHGHARMRWDYFFANRCLTALFNYYLRVHLTDMETGYKLFRVDLLRNLKIQSQGFAWEVEITAKLLRSGAKILELPISFHGRDRGEGKKIRWRDGPRALWELRKYLRAR